MYTKLNLWHVKVQQMVNEQRNVHLRKTNEVQSNMKVNLARGLHVGMALRTKKMLTGEKLIGGNIDNWGWPAVGLRQRHCR
jgi:hypothetical protein